MENFLWVESGESTASMKQVYRGATLSLCLCSVKSYQILGTTAAPQGVLIPPNMPRAAVTDHVTQRLQTIVLIPLPPFLT